MTRQIIPRNIPAVLLPALSAAFLLAACSAGTQATIDAALGAGEQGIKAAKDREAIALKEAPCLMGVGAYNRVLQPKEKDAIMALCGGETGLTLQDLQNLSQAMQRLGDLSAPTLTLVTPPAAAAAAGAVDLGQPLPAGVQP